MKGLNQQINQTHYQQSAVKGLHSFNSSWLICWFGSRVRPSRRTWRSRGAACSRGRSIPTPKRFPAGGQLGSWGSGLRVRVEARFRVEGARSSSSCSSLDAPRGKPCSKFPWAVNPSPELHNTNAEPFGAELFGALNPKPSTPNIVFSPLPLILNPQQYAQTPNPNPETFNPKSQTLNPQPSTPNPKP